MKKAAVQTVEIKSLRDCIHVIRGVQVMLDFDLAAIYGYSTKDFNRQVKNNIEKFDADFMFRLTEDEAANLRCKFSTSNWGWARYGLATERIYHCGASSKNGGNRVMTIERVSDVMPYRKLLADLLNNPKLVLK